MNIKERNIKLNKMKNKGTKDTRKEITNELMNETK